MVHERGYDIAGLPERRFVPDEAQHDGPFRFVPLPPWNGDMSRNFPARIAT